MEWYQNEDWVTARITKKTKFDFPPSKVQIKFEEKHCAVIIAGSVFWECNLSGRIIPDKSKGQISGNKRWLELKLKKADQVSWKKLESSSGVKKHNIGKLGSLPKFISQKILPGLLGKRPAPLHSDALRRTFEEDFQDDFISTCRASLARLEKLHSAESELQEIREQLEEKKVLISIFGFHNSGKSTLLNAILGDELLPMNASNETSLKVNMKHDPEKHIGVCSSASQPDGRCEKCPELRYTRGCTETGCIGALKIMASLQEANARAREVAIMDPKEATAVATIPLPPLPEHLILANIPILSNVPDPWKAYLVDNPGFDDPIAGITDVAEAAMKTTSGYMYILDYGILQGQSDTKHFKLLYEKDPDIFSSEHCRIVIVVTKFDNYYTASEQYSQISEEKIKEGVCASIERATGNTTFPKRNIVPVSGKMALYARMLRGMILPWKSQKAISRLLEDYIDSRPAGEDEVSEEKVPTDRFKQADMLEKASGLKALEERMNEMMSHCVEMWVENITSNCWWHMMTAVEEVKRSIGEIEQHVEGLEQEYKELISFHEMMLKEEKKLKRTIDSNHNSAEYKELVDACKKDIEKPTLEVSVWTSQLVDQFKEDCMQKAKRGKYITEEFERDMDTFLADASQKLITKLGTLLVFNEVYDVRGKQEKTVGKAEGNIRRYAERFCDQEQLTLHHHVTNSDIGRIEPSLEQSACIADVVREAPPNLQALQEEVNLPTPELSLWTTIKRAIKKFFGGDPETIKEKLRTANLDEPIRELREAATEGSKKYLEGELVPILAEHFYKAYCHSVRSSLNLIEQKFGKRIKAKQEEQMERKTAIDLCGQEKYMQSEWCEHMNKLAKHLRKKAEEFKMLIVHLNFNRQ